ncbi:hypothetical protein HPB47_025606 [Ixodes persulcatus]|uniref:Uncharacterized protein n=1 Tax=Ixodes persulcatus TaxID=34615 RepID=A0AC60Q106_IXOPE|nr:hypothetical protein HPB47_025606 [Ixodes persulcatus]
MDGLGPPYGDAETLVLRFTGPVAPTASSIDRVLKLLDYELERKLGDIKARFREDCRPCQHRRQPLELHQEGAGLPAPEIRPDHMHAGQAESRRQALETGPLEVSSPWRFREDHRRETAARPDALHSLHQPIIIVIIHTIHLYNTISPSLQKRRRRPSSSESPSRMQVEIQVALNFLVSFLYNKLPRRRVNQFAEELDRALRRKFRGHWYPDKPYRGSAFRCVKTSPPLDPVFQVAARESGLDIRDVRENLPPDLSIWIDPGEVSYRLGEKGVAQILLGGPTPSAEPRTLTNSPGIDETLAAQLAGLGLGPALLPPAAPPQPPVAAPASAAAAASRALTFTTASFAQTKFGSTKLKTSSKRGTAALADRIRPKARPRATGGGGRCGA